jgi:hypothetical protein
MSSSNRPAAPTLPPTKADQSAAEFEARIKNEGESLARWSRLLELLEEGNNSNVE